MSNEWIKVSEAARQLGWCREGVRKAVLRGDFIGCCPIRPIGRLSLFVSVASVSEFVEMKQRLDADDPMAFLECAYRQLPDRTDYTTGGCWEASISPTSQGYVRVYVRGRCFMAHRVAYQWHFGLIPDDIDVHHECENTACWNPSHLKAVTRIEHQELHDGPPRRNRHATHCQNGHPFSAANTYWHQGRRQCRACKSALGLAANKARTKERTHCKHGHPLSDENVRRFERRNRTVRLCLTCVSEGHWRQPLKRNRQ